MVWLQQRGTFCGDVSHLTELLPLYVHILSLLMLLSCSINTFEMPKASLFLSLGFSPLFLCIFCFTESRGGGQLLNHPPLTLQACLKLYVCILCNILATFLEIQNYFNSNRYCSSLQKWYIESRAHTLTWKTWFQNYLIWEAKCDCWEESHWG